MLHYELLRDEGLLIVTPEGPLESADFENMAREVDPFLEEKGGLQGLMILAEAFPGWHDFGALVSHLKFVKQHHRKIDKIAAVTDSGFLSIMPSVTTHFVHADVKHFDYVDKDAAMEWLKQPAVAAPQGHSG